MKIRRILYPIQSLGPNNRLVIYTQGCNRNCFNCASPELQNFDNSYDADVISLCKAIDMAMIESGIKIDGITITGGEPLQQPVDELIKLLEFLNKKTDDILIYTGYKYDDLAEIMTVDQLTKFKSLVSVLIDGEYIDELNITDLTLRGSANQNIIMLDPKYELDYKGYIANGRKIQNVLHGDEIISVGIHSKEEK